MIASPQVSELSGLGAGLLQESGLRIVITGASGWLGTETLEMLRGILGDRVRDRVICLGTKSMNIELAPGGPSHQQFPLEYLADLDNAPTLLFHFAFLTRDKLVDVPLAEYVFANRELSGWIQTQLTRVGVTHLFLASSGAVYDHDGGVGTSLELNPYGALKREDEIRFLGWAETQHASISIARIFNLSGRYINKLRTYALASLVLDALRGRPLKIRADHPVVRSYVPVPQLISVAIAQLLGSFDMTIWDSAGTTEVEIGELADCIVETLGGSAEIDRPTVDHTQCDRYVGDSLIYAQALSRFGIDTWTLMDQIRLTANGISDRGLVPGS